MHVLNNINELSFISGAANEVGCREIGCRETVYFDTLPGFTIIGLDITLITFDVYLDNIYRSHYNEWVFPVYEVMPI